jgi:RND family efflux transporter MFP subunit
MATPPSNPGPDLGRLRIERGDESRGRVRGASPLWLFLLLAVAGLGYLFRGEILGKVEEVRGGPTVQTARAQRVVPGEAAAGDVAQAGYVVADRTASLASVISGRLVELNAQEGQFVEANAVVARVQYDDLEAQEREAKARTASASALVTQARKSVEAARMDVPRLEAEGATLTLLVAEARENVERLEREVERKRGLVPHVVTRDDFDRLEASARAARHALEAAEARVATNVAALAAWGGEVARREAELAVAQANVGIAEQAEAAAAILVEKTRIRAPFRGLVIRKDAEVGEVIAPTGGGQNSKGSVLTIVDPESFEMQVELNERRIGKVKEGDAATIKLDADVEKGWSGKVRKIWPRADRSKGTIEVRVTFVERPEVARPDMAGQVFFHGPKAAATANEPPYVTVPPAAVAKRAGKDVVFVLEAGVARQVAVEVGAPKGGGVVIARGLAGGETVVLSPAADLVDGAAVQAGS